LWEGQAIPLIVLSTRYRALEFVVARVDVPVRHCHAIHESMATISRR